MILCSVLNNYSNIKVVMVAGSQRNCPDICRTAANGTDRSVGNATACNYRNSLQSEIFKGYPIALYGVY